MTPELIRELMKHVGKATAELLHAAALAPAGTMTKACLLSLWRDSLDQHRELERQLAEATS